jgi:DNA invertase Pin-like site-specific DNA recombinase
MEDQAVPVVSYARISADTARDEHGVTDQHKVNRDTAARLGWTVVHEITDNDRSASKLGVVREGFEQLLRILRSGHLPDGTSARGVVVVADDRLARRSGDYERFVDALTHQEGRVYADARGRKDMYSEDVEGMGLIGVAFAKIETRKIKRRMRRSHRSRAELGKPVGGTRPFGWLDDRLTLDPVEAPLLAKAVEQFIVGRSMHSIVLDWQQLGVKTVLGNQWTTRSLRVTLANPRMCGWRRLNGEIVRDDGGNPIVGCWERIVEPEQWMAVDAIITARKGHAVLPDGSIGAPIQTGYREPRTLLTGVLRCGKPKPEGSICGVLMRTNTYYRSNTHLYTCPGKTQGGCGGVARNGPRTDEYVTEAVLAKLDERQAVASDSVPWLGAQELERVQQKLGMLTRQWQEDRISDGLYFANVEKLEGRIRELTNERNRHAAVAQRAVADVADVRRRWFSPVKDGGLDLSEKRAYVREALHAVIISPAGKGVGSHGKFNPDLLQLVWRP